jgi:hypothetical protein
MTAKEEIIAKLGISNDDFLTALKERMHQHNTTANGEVVAWHNELFKDETQVQEKIVPRGVDVVSQTTERVGTVKNGSFGTKTRTTTVTREDFDFAPAKRTDTHMRIALFGTSGCGKTYSALLLAKTLAKGGKIAVIDTEDNSAALYDHITKFDTLILRPPYSPERYTKAIEMAVQKGYSALIIDSLTHVWTGEGGILDIVGKTNKVEKDQREGWRNATPRYEHLLETIKTSPIHTICTVRTKTKLLENKETKKLEKHNDEPIMRDGIEYEFTTVLDIDISHLARASKDRTEIFDTIEPQYITEKTGQLFLNWLEGK